MKTYKNFEAVVNNNNKNNKYKVLLYILGRECCERILLSWVSLDKLVESYKKDTYLNNIYKHSAGIVKKLPPQFRGVVDRAWEWDLIGEQMLASNCFIVKIKGYSLCDLTCLAKECARYLIKKSLPRKV